MGNDQSISFQQPIRGSFFFFPKSKRNITSGNITSGNITSGNITSGNEFKNLAKTTWSEMKIYLLGLLVVAVNVSSGALKIESKQMNKIDEYSPVNVAAPSDKDKNKVVPVSRLDMLSAQIQRLQDQVDDQQQRRLDNDTVEHLKEWVRAEIAGLSQCELGSIEGWGAGPKSPKKTYTISFRGNYKGPPSVQTAVKGLTRYFNKNPVWSFRTGVQSITTTQMVIYIENKGKTTQFYYVSWIVCA